jgi:hypothetical protein
MIITYINCDFVLAQDQSQETAPTVSISPTFGGVSTGDEISVTAYDSTGIDKIIYSWNNKDFFKLTNIDKHHTGGKIEVPNCTGNFDHLKVIVLAKSSSSTEVTCKYQIYSDKSQLKTDVKLPTVTVIPTAGVFNSGDLIEVNVTDSSGIIHIGYAWNSNSATHIYSDHITLSIPDSGKLSDSLHVYAKDNSIQHNFTGWQTFKYYSLGKYDHITARDKQAPTLVVKPAAGNIRAGDTISVTALDQNGISSIEYYWNSDISKTNTFTTNNVQIAIDRDMLGSNTLHIRAIDNSPNYNAQEWTSNQYNISKELELYTIVSLIISTIIGIAVIYVTNKNKKTNPIYPAIDTFPDTSQTQDRK